MGHQWGRRTDAMPTVVAEAVQKKRQRSAGVLARMEAGGERSADTWFARMDGWLGCGDE